MTCDASSKAEEGSAIASSLSNNNVMNNLDETAHHRRRLPGEEEEECDEKDKDCEEDDKKKKTDEPTYLPTISPPPTGNPTISPPPTRTPSVGDIIDTPSPAVVPPPSTSPSGSPSSSPTISTQPTAFPSSSPTRTTQPSVSPTDTPSSSPSSHPTAIPSMSPTTSAQPSMAPIPYARSPRINLRYQPWSTLTSQQQSFATQLDYNEPRWNNLGSNPVENLDWQRLERQQKEAAIQLGYDLHSWDCWQNHYQGYRWIDLNLPYIQVGQWWEILGWDIYSWNILSDAPPSDMLNWYELNGDERDAAAQLCYFRETWDEGDVLFEDDVFSMEKPEFRYVHWMEMDFEKREVADGGLKYSGLSWNVLGLDTIESRGWGGLTSYEREAAEKVGFTELSWDCWQNHFKSYSWDELEFYGLDFPYLALGWTELSWNGVEPAPPSKSMTWKELTQDERTAASASLCYFKDNWDGIDMTPNNGPFLFPKVKQRYVEWDNLSEDFRNVASDSLQYNEATWNNLGTAAIEKRSWEQLTGRQKSDAISMGFYQRTWDCFHNHYRSYEWDDLDRDSRDSLQVLGWNEELWEENSEEPSSYENEWSRLSENEQSVASVLCFFEDNWDGNSLEVVGVIITEDGTVVNSDGTIVNSDGSSTNGSSATDPNVQTPTSGNQGQADNGSISDILNPNDPANSGVMFGARRILSAFGIVWGTFIQLYL
ncbi:hypothetical protein ACHAXR_009881 [Thalassiosira sp. AJA248-18]